ncbi:MAG: trehalose-6-phosphate synthase, partial [Nitrospinota bacterium]
HDYHLALVPQFLRELVPSVRIAFFLHIPFPSPDIFFCLPWREPLLWGMLHSDLIGFHVTPYAQNFLNCVEGLFSEVEAEADGELLRVQGREVRLGAFPISIDFTRFEEAAGSRAVLARSRRLRRNLGERRLLLGVDRLDYTKGIRERLLAVEKFLEKYPEFRRRFVFVQVTVPSRARVKEYGEMKREIDEIVGRINGQFTEEGSIPIHYFYRSLPFAQLVAYYLTADAALVTPLKDGMNLVAKEYVACQVQNRGVLVLSEFTGAALELKEAIVVNPYNMDEVADAIHRAFTMPEKERVERMEGLRRTVRENDVHHWARSFLAEAP